MSSWQGSWGTTILVQANKAKQLFNIETRMEGGDSTWIYLR